MTDFFSITQDEFDTNAIVRRISTPDTGGVALFIGTVRGFTQKAGDLIETVHLFYEAYESMAEQKMAQLADEIRGRYPDVNGIAIVQRIGRLEVGDLTVLVACSAGHRNQGIFDAARYGIDRLKEIVPVWKKDIRKGEDPLWIEGSFHPPAE